MVYGEGQHIDTAGAVIVPYPTRTPSVAWRRSMGVLPGPCNTRLHVATISATQLPQALLEAAQLQMRHFGVGGSYVLSNYFQALTAGDASPPPRGVPAGHIRCAIEQARPSPGACCA